MFAIRKQHSASNGKRTFLRFHWGRAFFFALPLCALSVFMARSGFSVCRRSCGLHVSVAISPHRSAKMCLPLNWLLEARTMPSGVSIICRYFSIRILLHQRLCHPSQITSTKKKKTNVALVDSNVPRKLWKSLYKSIDEHPTKKHRHRIKNVN